MTYRAKRSKNRVPDGVVLHLDMAVPLVEATPPPLAALFSKRPPLSLRSVVTAIEAAATDSRVKGIVCTFGNDLSPPLAQVQELGNAIVRFREEQQALPESARKFAWVTTDTFGEGSNGVGTMQYYLSAHFDKVLCL